MASPIEIVALVLGAWGTIVSSLVAALQFRASQQRRVRLVCRWDPDDDVIHMEITNLAARPISLLGVDLAYGEQPERATRLIEIALERDRLDDGATIRAKVGRQAIITARERLAIPMLDRGLLWVRIDAPVMGRVFSAVQIDSRIIGAAGWFRPAEPNIATDLLLGFPRDSVLQRYRSPAYEALTK